MATTNEVAVAELTLEPVAIIRIDNHTAAVTPISLFRMRHELAHQGLDPDDALAVMLHDDGARSPLAEYRLRTAS